MLKLNTGPFRTVRLFYFDVVVVYEIGSKGGLKVFVHREGEGIIPKHVNQLGMLVVHEQIERSVVAYVLHELVFKSRVEIRPEF